MKRGLIASMPRQISLRLSILPYLDLKPAHAEKAISFARARIGLAGQETGAQEADQRASALRLFAFTFAGPIVRSCSPVLAVEEKAVHAGFNHHRGCCRDRRRGRAPAGSPGSVPDVARAGRGRCGT